jgi:FAD/FMN-containing dehydrogenase
VVIEHEPGDLTCTVSADVPLVQLQETLAKGRQMLALDPPPGPPTSPSAKRSPRPPPAPGRTATAGRATSSSA